MTNLLIALTGLAASALAAPPSWVGSSSVDEMTDEKKYFVGAQSQNAVFGRQRALLTVRRSCAKDEVDLLLVHPFVIGAGPVQIRVGKSPARPLYATKSSNGRGLFIGDESSEKEKPRQIADLMRGADKVLVRYQDAAGSYITATFSMDGYDAELKKLKTFCGTAKSPPK